MQQRRMRAVPPAAAAYASINSKRQNIHVIFFQMIISFSQSLRFAIHGGGEFSRRKGEIGFVCGLGLISDGLALGRINLMISSLLLLIF